MEFLGNSLLYFMTQTQFFFDSAATTPCCEEATAEMQRYSQEYFGNPSSSHTLGQESARAIRDARIFFANHFQTTPEQVVFTGSGSEANNLAIYGIALDRLAQISQNKNQNAPTGRILCSAIEHPAVRKTVQSLNSLGFETATIPVNRQGQIDENAFLDLLTPHTFLVSIQQVNNIIGSILPVEDLAKKAKLKIPHLVFHTDSIQAFAKIPTPKASSNIDFISISGHKIEGPKGVGALIILNQKFLKKGFRPLIWGGDQEGGFRSGTQNPGLIAGLHKAAERSLKKMSNFREQTAIFRNTLKELLKDNSLIHWNSPEDAVPHIVSLSIPGFPPGPLAKLLDERGYLVSTGSACSSSKMDPDIVLKSVGFSTEIQTSAIRISFSDRNTLDQVKKLVDALNDSLQQMSRLLGGR